MFGISSGNLRFDCMGLKDSNEKTVVIVSGSITQQIMLYISEVYSCMVCSLMVKAMSVVCKTWVIDTLRSEGSDPSIFKAFCLLER